MDFWKTLVVLVRRWYVALPALVVSLGLAAIAYESVPSKYEATGSIVLLSPSGGASTKSDAGQTNPLLAFDGSLTTVSTAITQVLLSPAVSEDLYRGGATASYEVGNGNLDGPFINVVADGDSAAEAQRTVRLVLERARTELRNRQVAYHAPPSTYIQVDDLVQPTEAKELVGGRVRAAGAALALGLAASISTAFMIESVGENRRERRRRAQLAEPVDAAQSTPVPPRAAQPAHPAHPAQAARPAHPGQPVPAVPPVAPRPSARPVVSAFRDPFGDGYADRYGARYRTAAEHDPDATVGLATGPGSEATSNRVAERGPDRSPDRGPERSPDRSPAERRNGHHHRPALADRGTAERAREQVPDRAVPDRARPAEVNGRHGDDDRAALLARRTPGRAED